MLISKFTLETFLAYLQLSSTDRLEPSLPTAKSAVTENIPKKQSSSDQHKAVIGQNESTLDASGYTSSSQASSVILRDGISQSHPLVTHLCVTHPVDCMNCFPVSQETEGEWTFVRTE